MTLTKNSFQGFSLLELLVSVAILSILAAITVANYNEFKVKAHNAVTEQFMRDYIVDNLSLSCSTTSSSGSFATSSPAQLILINAGIQRGIRVRVNTHLLWNPPRSLLWICSCAYNVNGDEVYSWSQKANSISKGTGNTSADCDAHLLSVCPSSFGAIDPFPIVCSYS